MASRSLTAAPSRRSASCSGAVSGRKCTPSTSVSMDTTSCCPSGTSSTAQSSPIPVITPAPACPRMKQRRISSNSPTQNRHRSVGSAPGTDFGRTHALGQLVENAVDVLVTLGGTEYLGQVNAFVDRHTIGHLQAVNQLVGADAQHAQ